MITLFKIQERRRKLRINNPASFGILCAMVLIVAIGLVYGVAMGLVVPGVRMIQNANATPSPTPVPTPSPTPETAQIGLATPETSPQVPVEQTATPTPEVTPTPTPAVTGKLYGKTIGIDPARGYDSKIKGASTGVYANRLNFAVAQLVKAGLEKEGATVVLTYTDIKQTPDDGDRSRALNNGKVDVALRIDCNSVGATDTRGAMVWAPAKHEKQANCDQLANAVLSAYTKATDLPVRLYNGSAIRHMEDRDIFEDTAAPIVTLFVGHISNKTEDQLVNDADFQQKMADGIVKGLIAYFG